jgi:hypothetical protein
LSAPSLVRRCPQASPRLKTLPTCGTSLNHDVYSRLLPFGHLNFRCWVIQECPHMNLQGWYRHHRQHQPALFQLAQLGVHHPGQQALRFYCLLLSIHHSKPLPANLTSLAPLLQGWSSRLSCNCRSPHQFSQRVNPLPIAPAPAHQHQPHFCSSPPAGPSTSVSNTRCPRPKPFGPLLNQSALQVSAEPCRLQKSWDLQVSANHCPC